ncbi:hypothetical protein WJX84_010912 [Apatococcus fuscideae]|uniref:BZIP domain-containing protein n=1 Tax=Apatococcus fuscideae TaxID=2026836 RepID=A0AAW1TEG2_9CHLO
MTEVQATASGEEPWNDPTDDYPAAKDGIEPLQAEGGTAPSSGEDPEAPGSLGQVGPTQASQAQPLGLAEATGPQAAAAAAVRGVWAQQPGHPTPHESPAASGEDGSHARQSPSSQAAAESGMDAARVSETPPTSFWDTAEAATAKPRAPKANGRPAPVPAMHQGTVLAAANGAGSGGTGLDDVTPSAHFQAPGLGGGGLKQSSSPDAATAAVEADMLQGSGGPTGPFSKPGPISPAALDTKSNPEGIPLRVTGEPDWDANPQQHGGSNLTHISGGSLAQPQLGIWDMTPAGAAWSAAGGSGSHAAGALQGEASLSAEAWRRPSHAWGNELPTLSMLPPAEFGQTHPGAQGPHNILGNISYPSASLSRLPPDFPASGGLGDQQCEDQKGMGGMLHDIFHPAAAVSSAHPKFEPGPHSLQTLLPPQHQNLQRHPDQASMGMAGTQNFASAAGGCAPDYTLERQDQARAQQGDASGIRSSLPDTALAGALDYSMGAAKEEAPQDDGLNARRADIRARNRIASVEHRKRRKDEERERHAELIGMDSSKAGTGS